MSHNISAELFSIRTLVNAGIQNRTYLKSDDGCPFKKLDRVQLAFLVKELPAGAAMTNFAITSAIPVLRIKSLS